MRTDHTTLSKFARLLAVTALASLAAACGRTVENPTALASLPPTPGEQKVYRLEPGDELDVKFFYNPELNEEVTVRPDGNISLQLIGETQAAGLTPGELERKLADSYGRELRNPNVAVILREFAGQRVYVDGEVGQAGMITLTGPTTVLQAIAATGGFKDTSYPDNVILIRRNGSAKPQVVPLRLDDARYGTDGAQDIYLQPYDIVYVPRSQVADANLFVDQVIRKNIPVPFGFGWSVN